MKRRDAIKNIGLAAGFSIVAPNIFSLLQSCSGPDKTWIPKFLSENEKVVLTNLVDIILPKTEHTPSATEVKVPQFIDKYIYEVLDTKNQKITRAAFSKVIAKLIPDETVDINTITTDKYTALLDNHLLLKGEIDEEREANPTAKKMTSAEFFGQIKWMTINAFRTSEQVGKHILVYDPIPTAYYCGDLQELTNGKAYSL